MAAVQGRDLNWLRERDPSLLMSRDLGKMVGWNVTSLLYL